MRYSQLVNTNHNPGWMQKYKCTITNLRYLSELQLRYKFESIFEKYNIASMCLDNGTVNKFCNAIIIIYIFSCSFTL